MIATRAEGEMSEVARYCAERVAEMRRDAAFMAQQHTNAAFAELAGALIAGARGDTAEAVAGYIRVARHDEAARRFLDVLEVSS